MSLKARSSNRVVHVPIIQGPANMFRPVDIERQTDHLLKIMRAGEFNLFIVRDGWVQKICRFKFDDILIVDKKLLRNRKRIGVLEAILAIGFKEIAADSCVNARVFAHLPVANLCLNVLLRAPFSDAEKLPFLLP